MKAWRFTGTGRPLEAAEVDPVGPGPGQVRVAVEAAGLCHSDLHVLDGQFPAPAPLTLGHEGAGTVEAVGPGVERDRAAPGDRVAILGWVPCGGCATCRVGRPTLCRATERAGLSVDGCFAEYWTGPAEACVPLPDEVDFVAGAVAVDAVLTPYHALATVGRLQAGETVAVIGLGGLGLHAVQVAVALGARVLAADPDESTHAAALAGGADRVVGAGGALVASSDLALDCVGVTGSLLDAQLAVRPGGRSVVVGLATMQGPLLSVRLAVDETAVLGSFWGSHDELRAVLALVAAGRVRPVVEVHPLDDLPAQVERLRRGEVLGRVALTPGRAGPC